jgi:hypothetical protein
VAWSLQTKMGGTEAGRSRAGGTNKCDTLGEMAETRGVKGNDVGVSGRTEERDESGCHDKKVKT